MTAEVAVLNKSAIAIAADSAVTTGFIGRERIFASANKIFTLSKVAPVGVMINGHIEHFGCPWEVIVKEFRQNLGGKTYPTLRNYVDEFTSFISQNRFITDHGEEITALSASLSAYAEIDRRLAQRQEKWSGRTIKEALAAMISDASSNTSIDSLKNITLSQFNRRFSTLINSLVSDRDHVEKRLPKDCLRAFREAVYSFLTHRMASKFNTGIVITGFGDDDIYPQLFEVNVDGGIFGAIRCYEVSHHDLEKEKDGAVIKAFAQDETVNAFLLGTDDKHRTFVAGAFINFIILITNEIIKDHTSYTADERRVIDRMIFDRLRALLPDFLKETRDFAEENYLKPIKDVIRSVPKDELISLAESLVDLTSLRKRVSGELQTVGGPVDVAVISRGDGFIWIKRKHYFDISLNPHFKRNYFREVR